MKRAQYGFIIPAYNPDENLIKVIESILKKSSYPIFVIDDGSKEESKPVFENIEEIDSSRVTLLKHAINLGKGAALKTLFNYILVNYPEIKGVVTLDSDGQHSTKDCLRVLSEMEKKPTAFVLGYRTFSKDIPLKSYIGNNISRFVYHLTLGYKFKDTQTGLRGLSREFMKSSLAITSNRFEFETEQLAKAVNEHISIVEIPIETIYIENNKATSFRPLVDSFKIYFVLLRYAFSSIITAVVDFIIFMLSISMGANVFWSNMFARTVSIGVQYTLLDKYVFYSKAKVWSFIFFALYVYMMGIVSATMQVKLIENLSFSVFLAKVLVEGVLFFVNFAFLRLYIFTSKSKNNSCD